MTEQPHAAGVPPVEVVLGDFVANLAMLAHAYLEPAEDSGSEPDLGSAEIVLDVAGRAFERIEPRLGSQERSAVARLLTESRLTYVRKRGP